jgi:hypothetical protein
MRKVYSFIVFLSSLSISGCYNSKNQSNCQTANYDSLATIIYEFTDSSVPPEYHRSFLININKNLSLKAHVDVYGDTIGNIEKFITQEQWDQLFDHINNSDLKQGRFQKDMPGSTTSALTFLDNHSDTLFSIIYDDPDSLSMDMQNLVTVIISYAPELDSLIQIEYPGHMEE